MVAESYKEWKLSFGISGYVEDKREWRSSSVAQRTYDGSFQFTVTNPTSAFIQPIII